MKKKTFIISTAIILVIILMVSVFVLLNPKEESHIDDDTGPSSATTQTPVETEPVLAESKLFTTSNGKNIDLTLKDSQSLIAEGLSEYVDADGSTYVFDEYGNLARVYLNHTNDVSDGNSEYVNAGDAQMIAVDFAKDMIGEKFDRFKRLRSYTDEDLSMHQFVIRMPLGKDGFIDGPTCTINVRFDGKVDSMETSHSELLNVVDASVLDNITSDELWSHALKVIEESCTTTSEFTSMEPLYHYIENVDGKFVIITEVKLMSKVDILNNIYGDISVDTNHPNVWKTETYNGPGALNVLVIYPLK